MRNDSAVGKTSSVLIAAAGCGLLGIFAVAAHTRTDGDASIYLDKARIAIESSEHELAAAVISGDTRPVERNIATDYHGVGPDGSAFGKAGLAELIRTAPQEYLTNRITAPMTVKIYGDTAIASGSESWTRRTALPKAGRFVWTDTWMRRDGQWQMIAGTFFELPAATD